VASRKYVCGDPALHQRRQLQQAECVGHLRAGAADTICQLLVRSTKVLQQLLVRRSFFERIQLAAVEVLEKCVAEQVVIGGVTDYRRDRGESGCLYRTPSTLAHHKLIWFSTRFGGSTYHNWLENAYFTNRVHKLCHVVLIEDGTRLLTVRMDVRNRDLGKTDTRDLDEIDVIVRDSS